MPPGPINAEAAAVVETRLAELAAAEAEAQRQRMFEDELLAQARERAEREAQDTAWAA